MRWSTPKLFCLLAISVGTAFSLEGGAVYKPEDFPYAVIVQKADWKTGCIGVIDSAASIVTSAKCLKKTGNHSVAPISNPEKAIPIVEVLQHKPSNAAAKREAGLAEFPEVGKFPLFGMVIGRAADPGLISEALAPKPTKDVIRKDAVGIIIGIDKAASMKVLSDKECLEAIKSRPELYAKVAARRLIKKDIFCAVKADVGDKYPPGYPCKTDAGAPIVIEETVGGLLLRAWCDSDNNHTAIFSSFGSPWKTRRFHDEEAGAESTTEESTTHGRCANEFCFEILPVPVEDSKGFQSDNRETSTNSTGASSINGNIGIFLVMGTTAVISVHVIVQ